MDLPEAASPASALLSSNSDSEVRHPTPRWIVDDIGRITDLHVQIQAEEDELVRGSDVIVIHPGSSYLRIGFATDVLPVTVPHTIGRYFRTPSRKRKRGTYITCVQGAPQSPWHNFNQFSLTTASEDRGNGASENGAAETVEMQIDEDKTGSDTNSENEVTFYSCGGYHTESFELTDSLLFRRHLKAMRKRSSGL